MRSAYASAFEFGPRDFGTKEILPSPLIFPQSDLGRQADSRWASPQISSCCLFAWTSGIGQGHVTGLSARLFICPFKAPTFGKSIEKPKLV